LLHLHATRILFCIDVCFNLGSDLNSFKFDQNLFKLEIYKISKTFKHFSCSLGRICYSLALLFLRGPLAGPALAHSLPTTFSWPSCAPSLPSPTRMGHRAHRAAVHVSPLLITPHHPGLDQHCPQAKLTSCIVLHLEISPSSSFLSPHGRRKI
jgi:hypothetical protein